MTKCEQNIRQSTRKIKRETPEMRIILIRRSSSFLPPWHSHARLVSVVNRFAMIDETNLQLIGNNENYFLAIFKTNINQEWGVSHQNSYTSNNNRNR